MRASVHGWLAYLTSAEIATGLTPNHPSSMTSSIPKLTSNSDATAEELLTMYQISPGHLEQIRAQADRMLPEIKAIIAKFYEWMAAYPDMMSFFQSEIGRAHV